MVLLNVSGDDFPIGFERAYGGFFVVAHETTITFDIGAEDRRELAFHTLAFPALIVRGRWGFVKGCNRRGAGCGVFSQVIRRKGRVWAAERRLVVRHMWHSIR